MLSGAWLTNGDQVPVVCEADTALISVGITTAGKGANGGTGCRCSGGGPA